jgi:hypothetical protein
MSLSVEPLDEASVPAPALLLDGPIVAVDVAVHDATRLAWNVTVPLPRQGSSAYSFELDLEVPTNLARIRDPWSALQSYARLDGTEAESGADSSTRWFHRAVAFASSKIARARDGFARHCTIIRSSPTLDGASWKRLLLWIAAARSELSRARSDLLCKANPPHERSLADEFLSLQYWAVLTDCGRALTEIRVALEERGGDACPGVEQVEATLAAALKGEIAYRRAAGFALTEGKDRSALELVLARRGSLKKHFERVLFLEGESYELLNRLSGWLTVVMAFIAYLWFVIWQTTLERHPVAIGSRIAVFASLTAIAYASRERLKELGRSWIAGRVQRMFAQRVSRYRIPSKERRAARAAVVVSARESFSESTAQLPDSGHYSERTSHNVTLLRFKQRGVVTRPSIAEGADARQVRFIYRMDLSPIFPRMHDAVRALATIHPEDGTMVILDVPRNYHLPLRAHLRCGAGTQEVRYTIVLNKSGLVRVEGRT